MESNEENYEHRQLEELGDSDYEIVEGQPDIKGWDVKTAEGQKIGEVQELLFSANTRKVRYLVVNLDIAGAEEAGRHDVLIPIGLAELHESDDEVTIPHVMVPQLNALPAYEKGTLTSVMESQIRSILSGTAVGDTLNSNSAEFYKHDHFNDQNFYTRRPDPGRMANVPVESEDTAFNIDEGFTRQDDDPPLGLPKL